LPAPGLSSKYRSRERDGDRGPFVSAQVISSTSLSSLAIHPMTHHAFSARRAPRPDTSDAPGCGAIPRWSPASGSASSRSHPPNPHSGSAATSLTDDHSLARPTVLTRPQPRHNDLRQRSSRYVVHTENNYFLVPERRRLRREPIAPPTTCADSAQCLSAIVTPRRRPTA
jgi:hypothetical protein